MVVATTIRVVGRCGLVVLVAMVMVAVLRQLGFDLDRRPLARAVHGGRQRSPNGKQHCEQQQEPEAKGLHVAHYEPCHWGRSSR